MNQFGTFHYPSTDEAEVVVNLKNPYSHYDDHLQVLLINFFRECNITFSVVDKPSFQAVLHHLNPTVRHPTHANLLEMASANHEKFRYYDKLIKQTEIRRKMELEAAAKRGQSPKLQPLPHLNPMDFSSPGPYKHPLNLKEMPTQQDLWAVSRFISDPSTSASNWPCVVCLKSQNLSKTRKIQSTEASVFLTICVNRGVMSLDAAQRVIGMRVLKCCTDHFLIMYESLLQDLAITRPDQLPKVPDVRLSDMQATVRAIRGYTKNGKVLVPQAISAFRGSIALILRSYMPRKTTLAGFVGAAPYQMAKARVQPQRMVRQTERPATEPLPIATPPPPIPPRTHTQSLGEPIDFPEELLENQIDYGVAVQPRYDYNQNFPMTEPGYDFYQNFPQNFPMNEQRYDFYQNM